MSRQRLIDFSVVLLVACALIQTGMIIHREMGPPDTTSNRKVRNWKQLAEQGQRLGPADAPVTIVEFSDFQCPFCAEMASTLTTVLAKYPDDVALVYRHLPLSRIHPHAYPAAVASECAADQGKFREFHDALFSSQSVIGSRPWSEFAAQAGIVDLAAFEACRQSGTKKARVDADAAAATELELTGTPVLIVNEHLVQGAVSQEVLVSLIERERGR